MRVLALIALVLANLLLFWSCPGGDDLVVGALLVGTADFLVGQALLANPPD